MEAPGLFHRPQVRLRSGEKMKRRFGAQVRAGGPWGALGAPRRRRSGEQRPCEAASGPTRAAARGARRAHRRPPGKGRGNPAEEGGVRGGECGLQRPGLVPLGLLPRRRPSGPACRPCRFGFAERSRPSEGERARRRRRLIYGWEVSSRS